MNLYLKTLLLGLFCATFVWAQGPPITADKPIMLGSKSVIVKTLTEIQKNEQGTFTRVPLMLHYLPTSNTLVAVHIPWITGSYKNDDRELSELGDIQLLGKYQFYRKDQTGKTLRMVAKTVQNLPTGSRLGLDEITIGNYQGYYGWVIGYETLKYGISHEIGYNWSPNDNMDELKHKLGFGLPLLKPTYPVNQVNLYFEYQSAYMPETDWFQMLYAQGVQYARGRLTLEAAVQVPLIASMPDSEKRIYSIFLGTRFIF